MFNTDGSASLSALCWQPARKVKDLEELGLSKLSSVEAKGNEANLKALSSPTRQSQTNCRPLEKRMSRMTRRDSSRHTSTVKKKKKASHGKNTRREEKEGKLAIWRPVIKVTHVRRHQSLN